MMKFSYFLFIAIVLITSSCKISKPEKYLIEAQEKGIVYDAIIVPGVPFEDSTWSRNMQLRVLWAQYVWEHGLTKNIIFSGGAVYTKYSECKIMKLYAIEMGIPEEHIFMDSIAEHSTENVFYSSCVAKEMGFEKIALASDPYQTKSLKGFIKKMEKKNGTHVDILPGIIDTVKLMPRDQYQIDPSKAIGSYFVDITNTQKMGYRLKGTMGLRIDWNNCPKED